MLVQLAALQNENLYAYILYLIEFAVFILPEDFILDLFVYLLVSMQKDMQEKGIFFVR